MNLRYTVTPAIVRSLMEVEAARQAVQLTVLPAAVIEALRQTARLRAAYYSTRIVRKPPDPGRTGRYGGPTLRRCEN